MHPLSLRSYVCGGSRPSEFLDLLVLYQMNHFWFLRSIGSREVTF